MPRGWESTFRRVFPLLTVALLWGCQDSVGLRSSADTGHDAALGGAQLVIAAPLTIPAGRARLFFQDGGPVAARGLGRGRYDLYRPHCALEIDTVDHDGFVVQPGRFTVTRVERSLVSVVRLDRVQFAALSFSWGPWFGRSDKYHDGYHFWVRSDEQPAVVRLSCYGVYARWPDLYPPTLNEINVALGEVAALGGPVPGDW
jgi:hypothetical protein